MTKAIIPSGINLSESKDNVRVVFFKDNKYNMYNKYNFG